jgi:hypothetical protein
MRHGRQDGLISRLHTIDVSTIGEQVEPIDMLSRNEPDIPSVAVMPDIEYAQDI